MGADRRARRAAGHHYVWAFERPDTLNAAKAAEPVERAFARVEDAEAALTSCWPGLHEMGVRELRLCDRVKVLRVVYLPLSSGT